MADDGRPRGVGQWVWLTTCLLWACIALGAVAATTVDLWGDSGPEEIVVGQLVLAAPASWIAFVSLPFLPKEALGPDGGGGLTDGGFVAFQLITAALVIAQAGIVYMIGRELFARHLRPRLDGEVSTEPSS